MSQLTKGELLEICKENIAGLLGKSGTVLYSAENTLTPGKYYFLGLNPGGEPDDASISKSLETLDNTNAFVDQCWGSTRSPGEAPLQRRVRMLFKEISVDIKSVCASNLIFERTRAKKDIKELNALAEACWPVHRKILDIVQPSVIITHGKDAFDFVCKKHSVAPHLAEPFCAGHGRWKCRAANLAKMPILVGVPHLSRYDLTGKKDVFNWIRAKIAPMQRN